RLDAGGGTATKGGAQGVRVGRALDSKRVPERRVTNGKRGRGVAGQAEERQFESRAARRSAVPAFPSMSAAGRTIPRGHTPADIAPGRRVREDESRPQVRVPCKRPLRGRAVGRRYGVGNGA